MFETITATKDPVSLQRRNSEAQVFESPHRKAMANMAKTLQVHSNAKRLAFAFRDCGATRSMRNAEDSFAADIAVTSSICAANIAYILSWVISGDCWRRTYSREDGLLFWEDILEVPPQASIDCVLPAYNHPNVYDLGFVSGSLPR
jgi:hypothetical protein